MQVKAKVFGRVQGVGFRFFCQRCARALGLVGEVVNCPDGSVEVVACGGKGALEKLVQMLHEGPSLAAVDRVETRWDTEEAKYSDFNVR